MDYKRKEFLGVIIDENLDWKLQIANKKIGKGDYLLWRYKNRTTLPMKKIIYESFIRTHLTMSYSIGSKEVSIINS